MFHPASGTSVHLRRVKPLSSRFRSRATLNRTSSGFATATSCGAEVTTCRRSRSDTPSSPSRRPPRRTTGPTDCSWRTSWERTQPSSRSKLMVRSSFGFYFHFAIQINSQYRNCSLDAMTRFMLTRIKKNTI